MVADTKAAMLRSALRAIGAEGRVASTHTTTEPFVKTPNPKTGTRQQRFRFSVFQLSARKPRAWGALRRTCLTSRSTCGVVMPSSRNVCGNGDRDESPPPARSHQERENNVLWTEDVA